MRKISSYWLFAAAALGLASMACESGGVGDPCIPEDEYQTDFSGYSVDEVNIESRSFQCETRICLVNHFRGRVSCPYGQTENDINTKAGDSGERCRVPGTDGSNPNDVITVPVEPQYYDRQAKDAVYCSCRCDGPDPNARYCDCPEGYECEPLVDELPLPGGQLAGDYCVRKNKVYKEDAKPAISCKPGINDCGNDGNNP